MCSPAHCQQYHPCTTVTPHLPHGALLVKTSFIQNPLPKGYCLLSTSSIILCGGIISLLGGSGVLMTASVVGNHHVRVRVRVKVRFRLGVRFGV